MVVTALITVAAGTVVLIAVAASGIGPVRSLLRAMERARELAEDVGSVRRNLELLAARADDVVGRAHPADRH